VRSRNPWHSMIILTLLLVLIGSFAAAITLALKGASLGMILLGYVAGGWAGFLLGLPVILFAVCKVNRMKKMSLSSDVQTATVMKID
jgi:hypothetical protein